MALSTWADVDPRAVRRTAYYFGESTVYEGMPVCFDNSTTNWSGVDRADGTESTTTTEGSQNEGKWVRVENPNADNVSMFAGVVAKGSGLIGTTGPGVVDIYIPNGAIVPVRTDNNCLIDQTILAISTGSQELGVPLATDSRPVAIARETIDRGTAGLCLAELCPYRFIHQDSGGTALSVDDADTGTASIVNSINISALQTSGWCIAFSVLQSTVTTSNSSMVYLGLTNTGTGAGGFHVMQVRGNAYGTAIAGDVNGVYTQVDLAASSALSSGIATGLFSKVHVKASGGTHAGRVVAGRFCLGLDTAVNGNTAQLYFEHTTAVAETPDYLFEALYESSIGGLSTSNITPSHGIPVRIQGATYRLLLDKV